MTPAFLAQLGYLAAIEARDSNNADNKAFLQNLSTRCLATAKAEGFDGNKRIAFSAPLTVGVVESSAKRLARLVMLNFNHCLGIETVTWSLRGRRQRPSKRPDRTIGLFF